MSIRVVGELHAKFAWAGCCCRLWIPRPGPVIHWRRGRALRALRRPPYQLGRVADVRLCASPRILPCPPAPLAPSIPVGLGSLMGSALEGLRLHARKSSPCDAVSSRKREKVLPVRSNWPKFGVFTRAGRTFSRKSHWRGRAGRNFSRQPVLCPGFVGDAAYFVLAAMGVLHYMTPFCGVSPACRTPV